MHHHVFKVTHTNIQCLIIEKVTAITLQGCADFQYIMVCLLDSETVLVLAYAITCSNGVGGTVVW